MSRPALLACPSCSRHVRASEARCPFCQGDTPSSFREERPIAAPRKRLSRAALAFGASTVAVTALACGGVSGSDLDAGVAEGSVESGDDGASDAPDDHCQSATLYGLAPHGEPCPVLPDAAAPMDVQSPPMTDARPPNEPGDAFPPGYCDAVSHAAYGAPPPECQ